MKQSLKMLLSQALEGDIEAQITLTRMVTAYCDDVWIEIIKTAAISILEAVELNKGNELIVNTENLGLFPFVHIVRANRSQEVRARLAKQHIDMIISSTKD